MAKWQSLLILQNVGKWYKVNHSCEVKVFRMHILHIRCFFIIIVDPKLYGP